MTPRALFFDLDETLVVEDASVEAALIATCGRAVDHGIDVDALRKAVRSRARELWFAGPAYEFCRAVGISSWEGLHGEFGGANPKLKVLRDWTPVFRVEAWSRALADGGVRDRGLAAELAERFRRERRDRHFKFKDTDEVLERLRPRYRLAIITNGSADIQGEKIARTGLAPYFEAVVISADVGVGKPDVRIFRHAMERFGVGSSEAVMIGNSLERDIAGARTAGLDRIWVDRQGTETPPDDCRRVTSLSELLPLLI